MHKTTAGEKRKALKTEALEGTARLEDLNLWQMGRARAPRRATRPISIGWPPGEERAGKVRHVHLGSCRKVDHETALQKARRLKAEALAIKP